MLGMIFGVAAVVAMLSIGAGAQQQVMAFIEDLGVRNLIVEARETTEFQAYQKVRQQSPGLTFKDIRAMEATVPGLDMVSARKRFTPSQVIPKPQGELPAVYGVDSNFRQIAGLKIAAGRFFTTGGGSARLTGVRARRGRACAAVRAVGSARAVRQGQRTVVPDDRRRGRSGRRAI